ncbi:carboxypeptidase S1 [Melampsora larici-populina 98AG31]|uniref:Carboxypeptidase n=1 Tax=Melampsora larici-populina (strain 98AG31 / pathotype 3-4-7) TaxID=747676 RepID=F4RU05_MELLP|nr:carboxypeptidase S1 [Melampsora larici-populina 98AG31]EGG04094.1 carboxypeptidase S1 [Melampsora larici-populina 98AG31]
MRFVSSWRKPSSLTGLKRASITWAILSLIATSCNVFALATSIADPSQRPRDRHLQRRSGQIPIYNGIPGGGQESEAVELSSEIRIKQLATTVNDQAPTTPDWNQPRPSPETPINLSTCSPSQNSSLRIVSNSGVCETHHGVQTSSGYIPINQNQSMFYWLFEARKNPDTAPLVLWLNGGPGSSSMIGLFQENGPCRIKLDSSGLDNNPYSWTESVPFNFTFRRLYIDQPIGVGYSYGTTTVKTSSEAAISVYNALQLFYSDNKYKKFIGRDFAIWTESYGGHYGPTMADYFLQMNQNVSQSGNFLIPVKTLGIGNGIVSPLIQYPYYMEYAKSNPYEQLVTDDIIANATKMYNQEGGCKELITLCQTTSDPLRCSNAQAFCNNNILGILNGKRDVYDVRSLDPNPYPPDLEPILSQKSFQESIGAETNWTQSNEDVYDNFFKGGDWMMSSAPQLERIINSGVRTLIFDGDADYILNYMGVEAMVDSLNTTFSEQYKQQQFSDWLVDGQKAGLYKNAGTFSYLRVFGAGHQVPAYGFEKIDPGKASLIFFQQVMNGLPISSWPIGTSSLSNPQMESRQSSAGRLKSPFSLFIS